MGKQRFNRENIIKHPSNKCIENSSYTNSLLFKTSLQIEQRTVQISIKG